MPQPPDVPTLAEPGHRDLVTEGWNGVAVRADTPPAFVQRLHAEVVNALQSPEIVARHTEMGLELAPMTPEKFNRHSASETAMWGNVIRQANIVVE